MPFRRFQIPVGCVIIIKITLAALLRAFWKEWLCMKKSTHRITPMLAALAGALLGFALRCWQLSRGADITGRLRAGHPSGIVLAVFCAVIVADRKSVV